MSVEEDRKGEWSVTFHPGGHGLPVLDTEMDWTAGEGLGLRFITLVLQSVADSAEDAPFMYLAVNVVQSLSAL